MGRVSRAGILLCGSRGWENRGDEAVWVDVVVVGWMVLLRNSGIDRGQGTGFWGDELALKCLVKMDGRGWVRGVVIGIIYLFTFPYPLESLSLLCMSLNIMKPPESLSQTSSSRSISSLKQSAKIANATIAPCTAPDLTASSLLQYTDSPKRHQEIFLHNAEAFAS